MIEGIDYCFIEPKKDKTITFIKLLEGPYKGTIYKYGKVKILEQDDGPHLHFAFDVLESPQNKAKNLQKDTNFIKYAGDMLVEIMGSNLDEEIIDGTGKNDSKESDLQ